MQSRFQVFRSEYNTRLFDHAMMKVIGACLLLAGLQAPARPQAALFNSMLRAQMTVTTKLITNQLGWANFGSIGEPVTNATSHATAQANTRNRPGVRGFTMVTGDATGTPGHTASAEADAQTRSAIRFANLTGSTDVSGPGKTLTVFLVVKYDWWMGLLAATPQDSARGQLDLSIDVGKRNLFNANSV